MTATPTPPVPTRTVVHLMRHGEVHNPEGVLYGRLDGLPLCRPRARDGRARGPAPRGQRHRPRRRLPARAGPADRGSHRGRARAAGRRPTTRVIEADNYFEGAFGRRRSDLLHPRHWHRCATRSKPSWGEPYEEIARADARGDRRRASAAAGPRGGHRLPPAADLDGPQQARGPAAVARPAQARVHPRLADLAHLRRRRPRRRSPTPSPPPRCSARPAGAWAPDARSPTGAPHCGGALRLAGGLVTVAAACSSDPNSVAGAGQGRRPQGLRRRRRHDRAAGRRPTAARRCRCRARRSRASRGRSPTGPARSSSSTSGARGARRASRRPRPCRRRGRRSRPTDLAVEFIGLDKLESPETGLAFQKANKVTYPSLAYDGGVPDPRAAGQGGGDADDARARPAGPHRGPRLRTGHDERRSPASSTTCSTRRPEAAARGHADSPPARFVAAAAVALVGRTRVLRVARASCRSCRASSATSPASPTCRSSVGRAAGSSRGAALRRSASPSSSSSPPRPCRRVGARLPGAPERAACASAARSCIVMGLLFLGVGRSYAAPARLASTCRSRRGTVARSRLRHRLVAVHGADPRRDPGHGRAASPPVGLDRAGAAWLPSTRSGSACRSSSWRPCGSGPVEPATGCAGTGGAIQTVGGLMLVAVGLLMVTGRLGGRHRVAPGHLIATFQVAI